MRREIVRRAAVVIRARAGRPRVGRRRFLVGASALGLASLLASCSLTAKPQPALPTPTPRPTPTATPTAAAVRPGTVAPTARPRATVTAATAALPAPRGLGQLLYAGTLDGVRGIILASGDERRLLATGQFEHLAWAPDSTRFAALAAPTATVPSQQVVIFAVDGRPLARFPIPLGLPIVPDLLWSPDARHLAYQVRDPNNGALTAWIADERGLRELPLGTHTAAWRWTPGGQLAYLTYQDGASPPSEALPLAIRSADPDSEETHEIVQGAFWPLDLTEEGTTLYALGEFRATGTAFARRSQPTALLAVDLPRRLSGVVTDVTIGAPPGTSRWIEAAALAPAGGLVALWRGTVSTPATPTDVAWPVLDLIVVNPAGRAIAQDAPWEGGGLAWFAWSPDGRRLAYTRATASGMALRILGLDTADRLTYPLTTLATGTPVAAAWSQDSRWLAYADGADLAIAAAREQRVDLFALGGAFPAWRPIR